MVESKALDGLSVTVPKDGIFGDLVESPAFCVDGYISAPPILFNNDGLVIRELQSFLNESCRSYDLSTKEESNGEVIGKHDIGLNGKAISAGDFGKMLQESHLIVYASVGNIVSAREGLPITLPVENSCILADDSLVSFSESITTSYQTVIERFGKLLQSSRQAYTNIRNYKIWEITDTYTHIKENDGSNTSQREIVFSVNVNDFSKDDEPLEKLLHSNIKVCERLPLDARVYYTHTGDKHLRFVTESEMIYRLPDPLVLGMSSEEGESDDHWGMSNKSCSALLNKTLERQLLQAGVFNNYTDCLGKQWEEYNGTNKLDMEYSTRSPISVVSREVTYILKWVLSASDAVKEAIGKNCHALPEWSIELRKKSNVADWSVHPCEVLLQRITGKSNMTVEVDELDDECAQLSIRLCAPSKCLFQHYRKVAGKQRNAFGALANLLLHNAMLIAQLARSSSEDVSVFFYPMYLGGCEQSVQKHYNKKEIVAARGTRLEALRRYNNFVKRKLILLCVNQGDAVVDFACGHGQDLLKFADAGAGSYIGIDFSNNEIAEAKRRVKAEKGKYLLQKMLKEPEFYIKDLRDDRAWIGDKSRKYRIASFQLAIHYIVTSKESCKSVLQNVVTCLEDDGLFLGSTVCCKALASLLPHLQLLDEPHPGLDVGGMEWLEYNEANGPVFFTGNELFAVFFKAQTLLKLIGRDKLPTKPDDLEDSAVMFYDYFPNDERQLMHSKLCQLFETEFGIEYHFWLEGTINAPEFVFPFASVEIMARSMGLFLTKRAAFPQMLTNDATTNEITEHGVQKSILKLRNVLNFLEMTPDQQEIFDLYTTFVFEKYG